MTNQVAVQETKSLGIFSKGEFPHYMDMATKMANSEMVPKGYRSKPMDILIAIQMGMDLGLPMMQSLQDIAVINGKPSLYGDGLLAVVLAHPQCEYVKEEPIIKNDAVVGFVCRIKRKGQDEYASVFTIDDAKKASLWGKQGPWSQYPQRMLQMRARSFGLRDKFADALRGIKCAEEVRDEKVIEGELAPKKTQSDKINLLLAKKGINNESKNANDAPNNHVNNSHAVDSNAVILDADNGSSLSANETIEHAEMASNGESQSSDTNQENGDFKATQSQLESIEFLCHEKGLDKARKLKALDYFNVESFEELTENQANEMIAILGKME